MTRWEGVDESLAKMVTRANLDSVANRRLVREAFKDVQLGIDHCLFKLGHALQGGLIVSRAKNGSPMSDFQQFSSEIQWEFPTFRSSGSLSPTTTSMNLAAIAAHGFVAVVRNLQHPQGTDPPMQTELPDFDDDCYLPK